MRFTVQFTLLMNNLFDALNRRFPAKGVQLGGNDFQAIQDAIQWLDRWEEEVVSGIQGLLFDPLYCRRPQGDFKVSCSTVKLSTD